MLIKFIASVVFASMLLCGGFTFAGEVEAMREPASKVDPEKNIATGKVGAMADAGGTLSPPKTQNKKESPDSLKQKPAKMGINAKEYKPYTDGTGELKVK